MRRWLLPAAYLLLAWIAAVQQWSLQRPGDPYTHYNNYVIFRQAFAHLVTGQDLYVEYLGEHWDYFRYSPSFAFAFGAFAWMPDVAGLLLWNTLNASVLLLALWKLPALPAPFRVDRIRLAVGWFVAIEMMTALQNAQSNVLIAGLLIVAFDSLERRQNALAALSIVVAAFTKPFALVGFSLFLFYPEKGRLAFWSLLWTGVVAALPLAAVSPAHLAGLYAGWWRLLSSDFAGATGLSIMGWLAAWFNLHPPKVLVDLVGIALFCWPLVYVARYRDIAFRLLVLCNVLLWVVLFNHKAESSSYIIAICGVGLWFFSREKSRLNVILVSLAFVFTCLSPTDVFPRSLSASFFEPYVIKVVPCLLVWLKVTYELISGGGRPYPASRIVAAG